MCHGVCRDVTADDANCGACDAACPVGVGCVAGACTCMSPMLACAGRCIDPRSDAAHCGSCVGACASGQTCVGGTCSGGTCSAPLVTCYDPIPGGPDAGPLPDAGVPGADAGPPPGTMEVCVDTQSDPMHCGSCTAQCIGGTCDRGHCVCAAGQFPCGGECVDLTSDAEHCGTCANSCGAGGACAAGRCTACGTGRMMCGGATLCSDVEADSRNCGACAHVCPSAERCVMGMCACTAPLFDCGTGCMDLSTNAMNCGACGHDCGIGGACVDNTCTCGAGYMMCGTDCADVMHDRNHCGSCANACPGTQVCLMGACSSAPPTRYVDSVPSATAVPFIDACAAAGHTVVLSTTDDGSTQVPLPFAFRYWASDLPVGAMVNISSNGFISMNASPDATYFGMSIPSATTPNGVIALHWGDDYTSGMGICVATVGTAPNRQWVVEWSQSYYCCSPGPVLTYEAILNENSGIIDLAYETMTSARSEFTGLEDPTGTMGIGGCGATTYMCLPTAGTRVRFTPTP
jgi:hypothetical protein